MASYSIVVDIINALSNIYVEFTTDIFMYVRNSTQASAYGTYINDALQHAQLLYSRQIDNRPRPAAVQVFSYC